MRAVSRITDDSRQQEPRTPQSSCGVESASVDLADSLNIGSSSGPAPAIPDDLSRDVYCLLGVPIDAIEMPTLVSRIEVAATRPGPFVISTPNLHFLVNSLRDPLFRESLLLSDVCPADGMPVVWIARLMGIPMQRTAGSDMFEALQHRNAAARSLKIFFFGSTEGVVRDAARQLDRCQTLKCVGWICPGFGTVDGMGDDQFIERINASGADFLVAALGARKGQLWLQQNHQRLRIPIRAHLGAVVNFLAGTVARAPRVFRRTGLEWAWRIRQEPYLWRRYWNDGRAFIRLMIRFVLPLAVRGRLLKLEAKRRGGNLVIEQIRRPGSITVRLIGFAVTSQVGNAVLSLRDALTANKAMVFDLAQTRGIDARFFGLLLMVRKQLKAGGTVPQFVGLSPRLERSFRLHGLGYLLEAERDG